MQLGALLSQINNFLPYLGYWSICLLATTIWNILHTNLTPLIWYIYFDRSYKTMEQRWKQGLWIAVCVAIATTITASVAYILRFYLFSRTGLPDAIDFGSYSLSCLITWLSLDLGRTYHGIGHMGRMKRASKVTKYGSQILHVILCTNNWFFFHEFSAQANNNDIEVRLILEFLLFNSGLAASALLIDFPSSKPYEKYGVLSYSSKRTD